jgi:toxin secretion/phage lysis holin
MLILEKKKGRRRMGKFPTLTAILGTPIAFLFGEWTPFLSALLLFSALDLITGFVKAIIKRKLRSREMYMGMIRKTLIWVVLIVANQIDIIMFDSMPLAKTAATFFYLGMEGLSIIENIGECGVPIPKWIKKYLLRLQEQGDEEPAIQKVDEIKVKVDNQEVKLTTRDDIERVD